MNAKRQFNNASTDSKAWKDHICSPYQIMFWRKQQTWDVGLSYRAAVDCQGTPSAAHVSPTNKSLLPPSLRKTASSSWPGHRHLPKTNELYIGTVCVSGFVASLFSCDFWPKSNHQHGRASSPTGFFTKFFSKSGLTDSFPERWLWRSEFIQALRKPSLSLTCNLCGFYFSAG